MRTTKRHHLFICTFLILTTFSWTGCTLFKRAAAPEAKPLELNILAVNDIHAALPNFPRFAYMVDSLRGIYPGLLLVSGGDNQTGNPLNDQYIPKGLPVIELMNALRFDISAVGNHEFDTNGENNPLDVLVRKANFEFISANTVLPRADFPFKTHKIMRMPSGLKVGFTSLLDINSGNIPDTHPDRVREFHFEDPLQVGMEMVSLKDSCDLLIYLNHYGFGNDVELAKKLPAGKVDLIIGGHSHTTIDTEQVHNNILITQAGSKLKYATLINVVILPGGEVKKTMKLLPVGQKGNIRPEIQKMVERYQADSPLKEVVAQAEDHFTSSEQLGYLMADAFRKSAGAEIALVNPGSIRMESLNKGNISLMDVYTLDPFGNEMVLINLTGHEMRAMMLSGFEMDEKRPMVPSGLKLQYTLDAERNVKDVRLFNPDGSDFDMDKVYKVVMSSYMNVTYKYEHSDAGKSLFRTTAEGLIDYLREIKTVPSYRKESRISGAKL